MLLLTIKVLQRLIQKRRVAKNREKTRDKSVDKKDKAKEEKSSNAFI